MTFLSQGKFGKYRNVNYAGFNKEVYVNNSSELYTGMSGGSYINQDKSFQYNYTFSTSSLACNGKSCY